MWCTDRLELGDDAAGLLLVQRELVLRAEDEPARHGGEQQACTRQTAEQER